MKTYQTLSVLYGETSLFSNTETINVLADTLHIFGKVHYSVADSVITQTLTSTY